MAVSKYIEDGVSMNNLIKAITKADCAITSPEHKSNATKVLSFGTSKSLLFKSQIFKYIFACSDVKCMNKLISKSISLNFKV